MYSGKKMGIRPQWLAAGLLVVMTTTGLSGCAKPKADNASAASRAAVVNYAVVQQVAAPEHITGTGTVSAWQEVPVGAETGGLTAVALLADEGQSVKQGQPLLKMDDVLLQAQLKQASANYDQANKAYQRANTLFKQGYLSAAGLDQAQASMLTTQAALETAQTQLSLATVRAPVAGIVTSRKAVLGQIVQAGAELFRIVRDGRVELNMEVVEGDLHDIQPGMSAVVTSESTGPVNGTVRIVTPQVDPDTRLGYARISVPWSSGLRPGMFAQGSIDAGIQNVLTVPQSAIVYAQNQPAVYYVGSDNKAHLRKVTLGDHLGKDVVIKTGVSAGDRVVTTGAGFLNDGDMVRLAGAAQVSSGTEATGG
ncbi:efflux RND transporter periplasmic adaptor subunit [Asticcacaulis sp. EMRT-3]|uniref:efflux RND transporter periplasmic adaptor subunit n=1 Tax=Asticcacaulis sp. EMRT-3 TaxID=3040349 RepID=UPI0024AE987A|nr:efflux RND transporter periplasmic adaptor subunit [Asticcacaulis sp. EMRT-3]MDI7774933.1 efflux RND transporter periplasmic adaptor subunit [Asticcacaulis sp. EMRT-3]